MPRFDYNVIGANVAVASLPLAVDQVIGALPAMTCLKTDSRFEMVRVDGRFGADDWHLDPGDVEGACKVVVDSENLIP